MPFVDVTVTGGANLQRLLEALPEKVRRKFERRAFKASAEIVLRDAKGRVSVDSGAVRDTMRTGAVRRNRSNIQIRIETGTRQELARLQKTASKAERVYSEKGYYPFALEYGTSKMRARPFMRPALDLNRARIVALFAEDLKDSVEGYINGD